MSKVCKVSGRYYYVFGRYIVCILKHNNVYLIIDRCILKDTKVFGSFSNFFGCIYSVLHRIGSVFQCNSMHL
jgi:hypothetical protein